MLKELVVALVKGLNSSPAAIIKKITGFGVSVIMEVERSCLTFPPLGQVDGVEVQHESLGGYISSYSKQIEVHAAEVSFGATAQGVASILCAHGPEVERRICTIWEAAYGLIPIKSSVVDLPEIIVVASPHT
ncbi:hypothetical protein KIW84_034650 [Lathyrus oleraceus]|uniref:Uncharacterized protein n=1 Tax=Pisum sativum TaxID=3888 RepID=A0A9D4XZ57_PEA|nr:hypothetical protein KIW84_034650 [Pisum sativum]